MKLWLYIQTLNISYLHFYVNSITMCGSQLVCCNWAIHRLFDIFKGFTIVPSPPINND